MRVEEGPKTGNGETEAIKWSGDLSAPLSSSMTIPSKQGEEEISVSQQREGSIIFGQMNR
jgi:hypothetical protein